MSSNIADVGPLMAMFYTGPRNVSKDFVHVWTIADFENKMKKSGGGIETDIFHIGDTQLRLVLLPNGTEQYKGLVKVLYFIA